MNTLNKKINNLKEIIKDLENNKRLNDNINFNFIIDDTQGGNYQTGIRLIYKNSFKMSNNVFLISTYNYSSLNDLENILKNKKCFLISKKNKNTTIDRLITDEEYKNYEIEKKLNDIFSSKKGTKKDFKDLDQDYLFIFYILNPYFLNDGTIEIIHAAEQLKNF